MESRWRPAARRIVAEVLRETKGQDEATVRRALREAYPFSVRQHWPYKVWLDEIQRQRGTGRYAPRPLAELDPRQGLLFD